MVRDTFNIMAMNYPKDREYLEYFAENIYTGEGEIVELGTWFGSLTNALLKGLIKNKLQSTLKKKIHTFDRFTWHSGMCAEVKDTEYQDKFKSGDYYFSEFQKNTTRLDRCLIYIGDIIDIGWTRKKIELLVVDAMKSWKVTNTIIKEFYSCLIPQKSVVFHQDYAHYFTPWIHLHMFRLKNYFEIDTSFQLETSSGMIFKNIKKIPANLLNKTLSFTDFSEQEIIKAFDYSLSLVGNNIHHRTNILAAKVMLYIQQNNIPKAIKLFSNILQNTPLEYELLDVERHLAQRRKLSW